MLARWPADKYNLTCEEVVLALADRCAARVVASRALFQQICFAWLTGNGDVHAKNLSILATPEGEWRVAPAYDLPSTVPYGDGSLALSLQGKVRGISRRRLLAFADAVGLPERIAAATLDDVLKRTEGLEDLLRSDGPPFGPEVSTGLIKEVRHRRRLASP